MEIRTLDQLEEVTQAIQEEIENLEYQEEEKTFKEVILSLIWNYWDNWRDKVEGERSFWYLIPKLEELVGEGRYLEWETFFLEYLDMEEGEIDLLVAMEKYLMEVESFGEEKELEYLDIAKGIYLTFSKEEEKENISQWTNRILTLMEER